MSQQLDRAGVRPDGSPALLTYTGQVMLVGDPEIGKTGNERPRKVVISDNPGQYQGKTFRCWSWKDDFALLKVGAQVTVHYEVEPNPNPERHGSNMISHVEVNDGTGGGQANGSSDVWGSASNAPAAATPAPTDWTAPPRTDGPSPQVTSKDDYWEQRAVMDEQRTLEIESAWAIKAVLDRQEPGAPMTEEQIIDKALQLVILKRRLASELGDG